MLNELAPKIAQLKADIALLKVCVNTSRDDPNWKNVCVAPPEDRTTIGGGTNAEILFVASMYLNSGDRCGSSVITKISKLN